MTKEALKLALEALEDLGMKHLENTGEVLYKETFTAIKEALANEALEKKAENARELGLNYEPVAFASHGVVNWIADKQFQHESDLYTAPQRKWVGLEFKDMPDKWLGNRAFIAGANWAAKQLKEKNVPKA